MSPNRTQINKIIIFEKKLKKIKLDSKNDLFAIVLIKTSQNVQNCIDHFSKLSFLLKKIENLGQYFWDYFRDFLFLLIQMFFCLLQQQKSINSKFFLKMENPKVFFFHQQKLKLLFFFIIFFYNEHTLEYPILKKIKFEQKF